MSPKQRCVTCLRAHVIYWPEIFDDILTSKDSFCITDQHVTVNS